MDGQSASTSQPADPDSDIMSVESIGGSDGNSDYVELAENSLTSPDKTLDLAGRIRKLEAMYEVLEGELNKIARPTVLFYYTDKIEIMEFADDETDPPEIQQDNGATPPDNTQPYPTKSPPQETSDWRRRSPSARGRLFRTSNS